MTIPSPMIIDACCAISLYASGEMQSILEAYQAQIGVVDQVKTDEIRFIRTPSVKGNSQVLTRVGIDFQPLFANKTLVEFALTEADAEMAVNFAALGGHNGESFSVAVAIRLGWGLITDDGPTMLLLQQYLPSMPFTTTAGLIQNWRDTYAISNADLQRVINNIQIRGRYRVSRSDPFLQWIQPYL